MAVNDIYEVVLVSSVNGQRVVNIYHFIETLESEDDIPAKTVAEMFETNFVPELFEALSIEATGQCVYARRIHPNPHIPFLLVLASVVGDISDGAIPSNAAAVISFYSDYPSRSGRGRTYISGIPESSTTLGLLNNTGLGFLEDFAELFADVAYPAVGGGTGSWKPCIWSPKDLVGSEILYHVVQPNLGSMRSRREPYGMVP